MSWITLLTDLYISQIYGWLSHFQTCPQILGYASDFEEIRIYPNLLVVQENLILHSWVSFTVFKISYKSKTKFLMKISIKAFYEPTELT